MDSAGWRLVVMSTDDGRELASFTPPRSSKSRTVRWTPDGSGLAYIDAPDGIDNIWIQSIGGGSPGRLTYFESGAPIEHFEWSRDGAALGIARETLTGDVVRITGWQSTSGTSGRVR
jgi:Tol biopolymer transport system component